MHPLVQDVRVALRFLLRNRSSTVATVAILGAGISLSATLFAIVKGTLLEPWPYRGYNRLVTVRGTYPTQGRTAFSLWSVPEIDDLRRASDIFEGVIAGDARNANLTYAGRPERVRAAVITPNVFAMLGASAFAGRSLTDADGTAGASPVVIVSYRFWQTRLGADPRAIGQSLRVGDVPYAIVGVMPEAFVFWDCDLWMPLTLNPADGRDERRYFVQAQLRPDVGLDVAASRLRLFAARLGVDHPERTEYAGLGITLNPLVEDVLRDLRPTLYLLLAAVALVLVVATANLANTMLARGMAREGELAIRRAIGGSAGQLARQMLVESAIVGAAGGAVGSAAAAYLLPPILRLIPYGYVPAEARVELDWRVVAAATVCSVGCGLMIGLVPALRAASVDPAALLKQEDIRTGSRRTHRWRDLFVTAQLILAVVIVGVAASAWSNLRDAVRRDPGYHAADVLTARIALPSADAARRTGAGVYARILSRLHDGAGVTDVAVTSAFPIGQLPTTLVSAQATASTQRMASLDAAIMVVSPGFFHLLDLPVVEGRAFADSDGPTMPAVVILSRSLARRLWADQGVLGRRVSISSGSVASETTVATVIGVAADVTPIVGDMRGQAVMFFPVAQRPPIGVAIGIKTKDAARALADISAAVRAVDPTLPVYGVERLSDTQMASLGPKLLAVTLLGLFGAAVLTLSAVGIYAVVGQSVQERGQELRIRLTFGAAPRQLFIAELRRVGWLVFISAGIGGAAAFAALRVLATTFPGFAGAIAIPLAVSTGTLIALALVATAIPAYQACRLDVLNRT
ncbi:MAG TPA: ABC transporter permease [Vicinamibacterales bacterium]|nr:ABC transporter permease [Vicinamibacterales bacterium]